MNVPCLNIRQEYGRIDIRNQNAKFDVRAELGELDITTEPAVLDINNENGRLEIDNYPCRYAIGYKNNADFSRDAAQAGMQAMRDFIARIIDNGQQFTNSAADSATVVANNAIANAKTSQPPPGISIKYIDRPQYSYTPDKLSISYQLGKVNTNVTPSRFENNSQTGSVNVSMAQYPNIRMWVTEGKYDMYA